MATKKNSANSTKEITKKVTNSENKKATKRVTNNKTKQFEERRKAKEREEKELQLQRERLEREKERETAKNEKEIANTGTKEIRGTFQKAKKEVKEVQSTPLWCMHQLNKLATKNYDVNGLNTPYLCEVYNIINTTTNTVNDYKGFSFDVLKVDYKGRICKMMMYKDEKGDEIETLSFDHATKVVTTKNYECVQMLETFAGTYILIPISVSINNVLEATKSYTDFYTSCYMNLYKHVSKALEQKREERKAQKEREKLQKEFENAKKQKEIKENVTAYLENIPHSARLNEDVQPKKKSVFFSFLKKVACF